jgi:phosphatidylinositol glycan class Z
MEMPADTLQQRSSAFASAILAFVVVFGIFNRITFPAFLIIPGLRMIPHFVKKFEALRPLQSCC